jgi:crossover junction endodeoxyribonuclease RuvC
MAAGSRNAVPSVAAAISRVLAIDPALRNTGYAILERAGGKITALDYGTIKNAANLLPSGCLVAIYEKVRELIERHRPECAAFESIIYVQSMRTAIVMGTARGAALLAAAQRGLVIHEYAPRRVKQSVVGRGGAQKGQVSFMVRALLGLTESPPPDAADALAIGLTHFQTTGRIGGAINESKRI